MNPDGVQVRQGPVHRKVLTLKTMHRPTLPRSGHWWDTGQFREDDRMAESLEAQLRAHAEHDSGAHVVRASVGRANPASGLR